MPKSISPKDRILAYAFTADVPALEDAIAVLTAALKAKKGGGAPRTRKPAKPVVVPKSDGQSSKE